MSRFRERGALTSGKYRTQDYAVPSQGGGLQVDSTVPIGVMTSGQYETIIDTVTPGFKKARAAGTVIMSPVIQTSDSRISGPSNWSFGVHENWGRRIITGDCCAYMAGSHTSVMHPDWGTKTAIARDEAIVAAFSRVAAPTTEGLVSIAEAKKTAMMLRSPFQKSRDLVSNLVGRRLRYLKKGMNYAAATVNAYLEVRFGFQPFLFEVANTVKAYNLPKNDGTVRLVARGSQSLTSSLSDLIDSSFPGTTSVRLQRNSTWKFRAAAGVLYELTESLDQSRARAYGLRLVDLPSALYELVPFSFVLDRYLRLGDWLQAVIPKPGVNVKGSWVTVISEYNTSFNVSEVKLTVNTPPMTTFVQSGGSYSEVIRRKERSVDISLPTLPPINTGEHSLVQMIDEIALTAQVLKTFDVKQLRRWETYAPKKRWVSLYRRHPLN